VKGYHRNLYARIGVFVNFGAHIVASRSIYSHIVSDWGLVKVAGRRLVQIDQSVDRGRYFYLI